jgi:hypothetical protein
MVLDDVDALEPVVLVAVVLEVVDRLVELELDVVLFDVVVVASCRSSRAAVPVHPVTAMIASRSTGARFI